MSDREKVIKGLEILMNGCEYIHCDDCCFYISTKPFRCGLREEQIQEDALALLKEQEAKKVLQIRNVAYRTIGYCPSCGRGLDSYEDGNSGNHITNYCYNCGQAVKWE